MNKYLKLFLYILIPLAFGFIGTIFTPSFDMYGIINLPKFAPPAIVFPIVWTILYILMGISSYLISNDKALIVYFVQLVVNSLWTLIFFTFNAYLLSSIWIVILIILVSYMIYLFFKENKLSAYLQIPYLLWLIFALVLNISVFILN